MKHQASLAVVAFALAALALAGWGLNGEDGAGTESRPEKNVDMQEAAVEAEQVIWTT